MEYRRIGPADLDEVAEFCIQGMRPWMWPMRFSHEKVEITLKHFMDTTTDFHMAAFEDHKLVGGIAAAVYESPWFERCDATVIMCRAIVPGVGRKLLAMLKAWIDDDMRIRRAFFPLEFDADPRMARLLARYGFSAQQTVCAFHKE